MKNNDWLDLNDSEENEGKSFNKEKIEASFGKKIYDSKKGKILLDLQKTYKGDERFRLGKNFNNDIEFDKLPNLIKLANKELEYDLEEPKKEKNKDTEIDNEKNSQLSILRGLFPKEKITNDRKKTNKNLIIPRFDPTQPNTKSLIVNETVTKKSKDSKKEKKTFIKAGIDKKKKNILKAESILQNKVIKKAKNNDKKQKIIKKIDYQAWKTLTQSGENEQSFKLFTK